MRVRGLPYPVMGMGSPLSLARTKGVGYEAESIALFARFTTPPDPTRKALINTLVKSLKAAGVWTKLDALYLFAAADAQAARRNWIQDLYNATAVSSPTFTADRGYTGDGAAAYLDTGFNPSTAASPQFVRNSAHLGVWDRSTRAANSSDEMGVRVSTTNYAAISVNFSGLGVVSRMNQAQTGNMAGAVANGSGSTVSTRTGASAQAIYKNGASLTSNTTASVVPPNGNIYILARDLAGTGAEVFSPDQLASAHIGAGLTSTEAAAMYAALLAYLQAVGAA